ncbi:MAG: hypothetical protein ACOC2C_08020, partial [Cyclonatronaceae bacterium]
MNIKTNGTRKDALPFDERQLCFALPEFFRNAFYAIFHFMKKDDFPQLAPALRGLAQLLKDAGLSITEITEELHHRIAEPPGFPATPVQRGITRMSGLA